MLERHPATPSQSASNERGLQEGHHVIVEHLPSLRCDHQSVVDLAVRLFVRYSNGKA